MAEISRRDAMLTAGVAVAGAVSPPTGVVNSRAAERETGPVFSGKIVVVQTRNRPLSNPAILSDCRFEWQGGRLFLTAIRQPCASHLPSWTDGARCCIAWECVEEYLVFDSLADYHGRLSSAAEE